MYCFEVLIVGFFGDSLRISMYVGCMIFPIIEDGLFHVSGPRSWLG